MILFIVIYWVITYGRLARKESDWGLIKINKAEINEQLYEGDLQIYGRIYKINGKIYKGNSSYWDNVYYLKERFIIAFLFLLLFINSKGLLRKVFQFSFYLAVLNFVYHIMKLCFDFVTLNQSRHWNFGFGFAVLICIIIMNKNRSG